MCRSISRAIFSASRRPTLRASHIWNIAILPVVADFTRDFDLPPQIRNRARVGFFPGSTIGNFEPEEAVEFLRQAARILGGGATMIVGVDLHQGQGRARTPPMTTRPGVTAKFNLNILARMNRELGGNFDLGVLPPSRILQRSRPPHRDAPRKP